MNPGDSRATTSAVAETARAATRPIVTVIFAGTIAGAVLAEIEPPPWFVSLAIPCILWYFGERTYMHRKENKQP